MWPHIKCYKTKASTNEGMHLLLGNQESNSNAKRTKINRLICHLALTSALRHSICLNIDTSPFRLMAKIASFTRVDITEFESSCVMSMFDRGPHQSKECRKLQEYHYCCKNSRLKHVEGNLPSIIMRYNKACHPRPADEKKEWEFVRRNEWNLSRSLTVISPKIEFILSESTVEMGHARSRKLPSEGEG